MGRESGSGYGASKGSGGRTGAFDDTGLDGSADTGGDSLFSTACRQGARAPPPGNAADTEGNGRGESASCGADEGTRVSKRRIGAVA